MNIHESIGSRKRTPGSLQRWAVPTLLICACAMPAARANTVDFVTRIGQCNGTRIDVAGNDADLQLQAGTTRFELWNDFIEGVNDIDVRVDDNDSGTVTTTLGTRRNGAQNVVRGCPLKGSVEVTVTSSKAITSNLRRELILDDNNNSGDGDHRQGINVVAIPQFNLTWSQQLSPPTCLIKTGTSAFLGNNKLIEIQLPAGHATDNSNCTGTLQLNIAIPAGSNPDVEDDYAYTLNTSVTELRRVSKGGVGIGIGGGIVGGGSSVFMPVTNPPTYFTVSTSDTVDLDTEGFVPNQAVRLELRPLEMRKITKQTKLALEVKAPNGRASTVTLHLKPNNQNGFSIPPSCAPDPMFTGSLVTCRVTLALPAAQDLVVSWRMTSAGCFAAEAGQVAYSPAPGTPDGTQPAFVFNGGELTKDFTVRGVAGGNCASLTGNSHRFEAWIGTNTAVTSGPTYTTDTFLMRTQL